jgi:hypothetical protein
MVRLVLIVIFTVLVHEIDIFLHETLKVVLVVLVKFFIVCHRLITHALCGVFHIEMLLHRNRLVCVTGVCGKRHAKEKDENLEAHHRRLERLRAQRW